MTDEKLPYPIDPKFGPFGIPSINSTGIVELKGLLSINVGATTIFIPAFDGTIYDKSTRSTTTISFVGDDAYSPEFLLSDPYTNVLFDVDGALIAINTAPTDVQMRDFIWLCQIQHPNGVITDIISKFDYVTQESNNIGDVLSFLDPVIRGCKIVPNGVNLQINIQAGNIMIKDIGTVNNPSVITIQATIGLGFRYATYNSQYSILTTTVTPNFYDANGSITAVPAGLFTIQRIGIRFDRTFLIQYGNQLYASMATAIAALNDVDTNFPTEPSLESGATLCYLILQQGTVSLLASGVNFIPTDNFGEVVNSLTTVSLLPSKQTFGALNKYLVNVTTYSNILYFPFIASNFVDQLTMQIVLYVTITDTTMDYQLVDEIAPSTLGTGTISTTGNHILTFATPSIDSLLNFSIKRSSVGGVDPVVKGVYITFDL
jgi:hypothetical protein